MSELGESVWGELCGIARSLKEKLTVSKLAEHDWSDSLEPLVCEEVGRDGGEEDEDEEAWEEEEDVSERTTPLQTVVSGWLHIRCIRPPGLEFGLGMKVI